MFLGWAEFLRDLLVGFTWPDERLRSGQQQQKKNGRLTLEDVLGYVISCDFAEESVLLLSTCKRFWEDDLMQRMIVNHAFGTNQLTRLLIACKKCNNRRDVVLMTEATTHVKKLLATGICDVNMKTASVGGEAALHFACLNNAIEIVVLLLEVPTLNLNAMSGSGSGENDSQGGDTALHLAVKTTKWPLLELLLTTNKQTTPLNPNQTDNGGRTALFWAVGAQDVYVVKRLLQVEGIDPNVETKRGECALTYACEMGHKEMVDAFLAHPSINVNIACGPHQLTPLMIASSNGWTGIVRALLMYKGCQVNKKSSDEWTALTVAAHSGISAALHEYGAV